MHSYLLPLSALAFASSVTAAPTLNVKRSMQEAPALAEDFPDPCVIQVDGVWHAFGTQSGGTGHGDIFVQHATSTDFYTWTYDDGNDVFPTLPAWATGNVWGPSVIRREDGTFVLYFSADSRDQDGSGGTHCLGIATASDVSGPYTPASDTSFACPLSDGGAIDPSGFRDDDGTYYVVYKVDGNAVGQGTPILLQRMESDAVTPTGDAPVELFRNGEYDSGVVEAPDIMKVDGTYFCFFSSANYCSTLYAESYAYASSLTGPWTKAPEPLLVTGDYGLQGPGGLGVAPGDNRHVVVHGWSSADQVCGGPGRYMFVGEVSVSGNTISI